MKTVTTSIQTMTMETERNGRSTKILQVMRDEQGVMVTEWRLGHRERRVFLTHEEVAQLRMWLNVVPAMEAVA